MKKTLTTFIGAALLATSLNGFAADKPSVSSNTLQAKGATVHALQNYTGDVSDVIELNDSLILIDLQPTKSGEKALVEFVEGLDKPLKAIIVSSHGIGTNAFGDVPVYETKLMSGFNSGEGIQKFIGIFSNIFGEDAYRVAVSGSETLVEGENTIDKTTINVTTNTKGFPPTSDIAFPEQSIYYTHLAADNTHFLIGNAGAIDGLIAKFEAVKAKDYQVIISAHGKAMGQSGVDFSIGYLKAAKNALKTAKTPEAYITAMKTAYPDAGAEKFLKMSAGNLFKAKH